MKRRIAFVVGGLAIAGGVWFAFFRAEETQSYESVSVSRSDLIDTVSVTGHAEPVERLSLGFAKSGTVGDILVDEGDLVYAGDTLARLDGAVLDAQVREARARVAREEAVLTELTAGAPTAERAVTQASLARARTARTYANKSLTESLGQAFVLADDAIREETDELFSNVGGGNPRFGTTLVSGTTEYVLRADAETTTALSMQRREVERILGQLRTYPYADDVAVAAEAAYADLQYLDAFVTAVAGVVNRYIPDTVGEQTVYESFQTSVASARTSISSALSTVRAAKAALEDAKASEEVAVRENARIEAPLRSESERVQIAALRAAQEALGVVEAQYAETVLTSPVNGVVTDVKVRRGEPTTPSEGVLEVLAAGTMELEAFIPEADIARVHVADKATVTFDAFGRDVVFEAEVVRISRGETVREGVPTYKTILALTKIPEGAYELRAGMTADIEITVASRDGVLVVPSRSVQRDGDRRFVRVVAPQGTLEERTVDVGLRGSDGMTEITAGLREGEEVVLSFEGADR